MTTTKSTALYRMACQRHSCRAYDASRNIDDATVAAIIEAARVAPSAVNRQPWRFVVVRDAQRRAALLAKSRPAFLAAPVLIAAVAMADEAWVRPADGKNHADIDLAIAVQQMMLQATDMGLGTCWVCSFDVEASRTVLCLPQQAHVVALVPVGYPLDDTSENHDKRHALQDIMICEHF